MTKPLLFILIAAAIVAFAFCVEWNAAKTVTDQILHATGEAIGALVFLGMMMAVEDARYGGNVG